MQCCNDLMAKKATNWANRNKKLISNVNFLFWSFSRVSGLNWVILSYYSSSFLVGTTHTFFCTYKLLWYDLINCINHFYSWALQWLTSYAEEEEIDNWRSSVWTEKGTRFFCHKKIFYSPSLLLIFTLFPTSIPQFSMIIQVHYLLILSKNLHVTYN